MSKIFTKHLYKDPKADYPEYKEEIEFHNDWFMEDPVSKGLVQEIEFELSPRELFTFIVVLKSPVVRKSTLFAANVLIESAETLGQHSVFCFGAMEVPKMICPKEIVNEELGYSSLKVIMKRGVPFQPIKVLLANNGELPIECQFVTIDWGPEIKFTLPRDRVSIDSKQRALLDVKA